MSTVLDEETMTVVLEGLDFAIPCRIKACENAATWGLSATCCGVSTVKCNDCLEVWRLEVVSKLGNPVMCGQCGHQQSLSFDWYRVVPL